MSTPSAPTAFTVTPTTFVSEVAHFQEVLADPETAIDDKAKAYATVVRHAALLDPREEGFERAGIALKQALCAWLCCQPGARH
jgi:hypothetical protein